jgi:hypothetical protein
MSKSAVLIATTAKMASSNIRQKILASLAHSMGRNGQVMRTPTVANRARMMRFRRDQNLKAPRAMMARTSTSMMKSILARQGTLAMDATAQAIT